MGLEYRRAPSPGEPRAMRETLLTTAVILGFGVPLFGMFLYWQVTSHVAQGISAVGHVSIVIPALVVGGIAGLLVPLRSIGRPRYAGNRFGKLPKKLSPYEQRLEATIRRLRNRLLMVLINLPLFAGVLIAWLETPVNERFPLGSPIVSFGDYILAFLLSSMIVFCLTGCVEFAQVRARLGQRLDEQVGGERIV